MLCFAKSVEHSVGSDIDDPQFNRASPTGSRAYVSQQLSTLKELHSMVAPANEELAINLQCIIPQLEGIAEDEEAETSLPAAQKSVNSCSAPRQLFKRESMRVAPPGLQWSNSRRALQVLVQREEDQSRASKGDHLTHSLRLAERLDRLHLQVYEMEGDGNCQFRSISHELFGTPAHYMKVRKRAIAHILSHKEDFECFLGEDFDDYIAAMSKDRTWGDELTLRAICEGYGITVHVVSSDEQNWFLSYKPQQEKTGIEVFITYIAPVHYNAIRRKPTLKTLHEKLGNSFKRMSSGRSSGRDFDVSSVPVPPEMS